MRPDNIQVLPLSQEEKNESDGKTAEKNIVSSSDEIRDVTPHPAPQTGGGLSEGVEKTAEYVPQPRLPLPTEPLLVDPTENVRMAVSQE